MRRSAVGCLVVALPWILFALVAFLWWRSY